MRQYQHLCVVNSAQRNATKIAHTDVDRHSHAVDGTTQHNAFAVKFNTPQAAVRAYVMRIEADRYGQRVSQEGRAAPRGSPRRN